MSIIDIIARMTRRVRLREDVSISLDKNSVSEHDHIGTDTDEPNTNGAFHGNVETVNKQIDMGNYYKIGYKGRDYVVNLDKVNTDKMLEDARRRFEEERAKNAVVNQLLQDTAARNNEGTAYEKLGREDEAIAVYEENIADGYPALHAFDRLMKIYRRRKDYKNEVRVIGRAIEVFFAENQRRADRAAEVEPQLADRIYDALLSCKKVMGSHGFYCFVPYDVSALYERLHKVEILFNKKL